MNYEEIKQSLMEPKVASAPTEPVQKVDRISQLRNQERARAKTSTTIWPILVLGGVMGIFGGGLLAFFVLSGEPDKQVEKTPVQVATEDLPIETSNAEFLARRVEKITIAQKAIKAIEDWEDQD